MKRSEARVLAIDPGKTCGMATKNQAWEMSDRDCILFLETMTQRYMFDRVVIERFNMRQHTTDAEDTIKLIGVLEYIVQKAVVILGWVNPSDKKAVKEFVPEHLKDHAWDAEAIRLWDLRYGTW